MKKEVEVTTKQDAKIEIQKLIAEIAQLAIDMKVNPPKDSNLLHKKRKQLARLRTQASSK